MWGLFGYRRAGVLAALTLVAAPASAQPGPIRLHLDEETSIGGIDVACTGVGQTKDLPKWTAYPVKLEFADPKGAYYADEEVTVAEGKGAALLDVTCDGPWLLLKLPPGKAFKIEARLQQSGVAPKDATVKAPSHGQATFVLTFPVDASS